MPQRFNSGPFLCRANAEASAEKINHAAANSYHRLQYDVRKETQYPRGRPGKGKAHTPTGYEYILDVKIDVDADADL